jgi:hypothetical protein
VTVWQPEAYGVLVIPQQPNKIKSYQPAPSHTVGLDHSTHAAKKFFRKLLQGCQYVPRGIITDKLESYGAAKREILPGVEQRQHRSLNNRAEHSHQPIR